MYTAGVAVECTLRAFKMLRDPTYDEKHDLMRLFRASGMLEPDRNVLKAKGWDEEAIDDHIVRLQSSVSEIWELWANDYRFASETRMRSFLKAKKLDRGIKGDALKARSKTLLTASQFFMDKGVFQWNLLKKSGGS